MSTSSILSALNEHYTDITSLVSNKYNFTDEPVGNTASNNANISDGGNDMYDGGNVMNTNLSNAWNNVKTGGYSSRLATSIQYTHTKHSSTTFSFNGNGTVNSGNSYFGTGSTYFTNLYPGMFVLVANDIISSCTEFSVTGNIGVDGGGTLATDDFTLTVGGSTFAVYRKSIYNTTDPSINHIFIIPGDGAGVTHSWDTSRQYDDNVIQGINVSYLYYLLISTRSGSTGTLLSHSDAVNVVTQFIETVGNVSSAAGGPIASGTSTVIPYYNYNLPTSQARALNAASTKLTITTAASGNIRLLNSASLQNYIHVASTVSDESISQAQLLATALGCITIASASPSILCFNFNSSGNIRAGNASSVHFKMLHASSGNTSVDNSSNYKITLLSNVLTSLQAKSGSLNLLYLTTNAVGNIRTGSIELVHFNVPFLASGKTATTGLSTFVNKLIPTSMEGGIVESTASIGFFLTVNVGSAPPPNFDHHYVGRHIYVDKLFVCENGEIHSRQMDKNGAWVSAGTVLNNRLYLRCKTPYELRPREGHYIDMG